MRRQDFEQAKVIKAQLDIKGHELLAQYEKDGGYQPAFFTKAPTGQWTVKDPTLIYARGPGGQPTM